MAVFAVVIRLSGNSQGEKVDAPKMSSLTFSVNPEKVAPFWRYFYKGSFIVIITCIVKMLLLFMCIAPVTKG